MITGSVRVDLSVVDEVGEIGRQDRRVLYDLCSLPKGVTITVDVGDRSWVLPETAQILNRLSESINLHFIGSRNADVGAWVQAARTGRAS